MWGHLEKQDACSGGHFAFENAWHLFLQKISYVCWVL
jgi:hypothetical protein